MVFDGKKNILTFIAILAFIDPFFSSGVHLAFTSALSAAASICASLRNDCPEVSAAEWHTKRVATSYTRCVLIFWPRRSPDSRGWQIHSGSKSSS